MTGARQPHVLLVVETVTLARDHLAKTPAGAPAGAGAAAGAAELAGKGA